MDLVNSVIVDGDVSDDVVVLVHDFALVLVEKNFVAGLGNATDRDDGYTGVWCMQDVAECNWH